VQVQATLLLEGRNGPEPDWRSFGAKEEICLRASRTRSPTTRDGSTVFVKTRRSIRITIPIVETFNVERDNV